MMLRYRFATAEEAERYTAGEDAYDMALLIRDSAGSADLLVVIPEEGTS